MKPQMTLRPKFGLLPAALACALLPWAAATCAAALPEPALQLSPTLRVPAVPAANDERALLRVEYRAAQSGAEEAEAIGDMLARMRHMEDTAAEIRRLLETGPTLPPPAAPPLATGQGSATIIDITPVELYSLVVLVAALTFFVWLVKERRAFPAGRRLKTAAQAPARQAPAADADAITMTAEPMRPPPHGPAAAPNADPAIELADIMISMGLTHGAAQTLSEEVHEHPKLALYHWLKLLEIYRQSDMREDFDKAASDLRRYFNVEAQAWDAAGSALSIEDYPHLAEALQALWPWQECAAFLSRLLEDNRGGTRAGFPQSVAEEILLLRQMLDFSVAAVPDLGLDQTGLSSST